jgi:FAD/FMN-containing dehydrogenase
MRRVDVDPAKRTVRAQAGAEWQDVTFPAAEHGLAALAGSSPNVGVSGYTLGGGIGWLARRYGLAAGDRPPKRW